MSSDPPDVKETPKPSTGPSLVVRGEGLPPVELPKKKPYSTPKLVVYGTLAEITKMIASGSGATDNAGGTNKTH